MKCRAKIIGTDKEVEGYYAKVGDKHYIIPAEAYFINMSDALGEDTNALFDVVEVEPQTIRLYIEEQDK